MTDVRLYFFDYDTLTTAVIAEKLFRWEWQAALYCWFWNKKSPSVRGYYIAMVQP